MAFNQFTDDLRAEALFRAGEPQSSSSSFWTKSLDYLNRIQQTLVLGGGVAVGRDLATSAGIYARLVEPPITDWYWARKLGVLTSTAAVQTGTLTATQGSSTVTFSSAPTAAIQDWRLIINNLPTVPRIQAHTPGSTTATLDGEWPETTQTAVSYTLFRQEYPLPGDFLRFATPPYAHSTFAHALPVATREQMDSDFPVSAVLQGTPTRFFIPAGGKTILLNAWDTRGYRFEFEYIRLPPALEAGSEPVLPPHYRAVLAVGAAMLILFDKSDGRTANLASEYREMVNAMLQEHRRALTGGSPTFGRFRFRDQGHRMRSPQPMGELYLT